MKEVKKTGHSKVNNNNAPKKKPVNKKFDDEAPRVTKIESPVKETKVVDLDNDFVDEENDQKLIVVIAIALLVIIATVVGLLVGCEKKEEEEPEKPKDDIVVPVEDDEDDKEEDVVKKTTTKVTDKDEDKEEVVISTYDITYYYGFNERTHHETVSEGNSASEYVPQGYNTCKYYVDEGFNTEYAFDNVYEDTNIYLNCVAVEYSVVYDYQEADGTNNELNPDTFTVENNIELKDLETTDIFMGWYLDNEYTNRVYELNRDLIKYADSENVVYLYAKVAREAMIKLHTAEGENVLTEVLNKETSDEYHLPSSVNLNVCSADSKFLGWTSVQGSKNVEYKDEASIVVDRNYTLYAVCGDATIQYVSNGETVTVAYTKEELKEAGFDLPAPSDMNMETPSYFVPVTEEVLESLKIVSDDELELKDNEVYYSDVLGNTREDYIPTVGDRVQAFDKKFVGWIEKTEEVETPENENTNENVQETTDSENNVVEDNTLENGTETEGEVNEEEIDLVTKEDVVEKVEDGETEIELEAVWEIPEEDPVVDEVTPEEGVENSTTEEPPIV